jgi:hypothetical protein
MKRFAAAAIAMIGSAGIALADDPGSSRGSGEESSSTPGMHRESSTPGVHGEGMHGDVSPGPGAFDQLDTNRDGKLSESEVSRMQGIELRKLDSNNNGTLDRSEWQKGSAAKGAGVAAGPGLGASFDSVDHNGDGSISKAEAGSRFDDASFAKADKNRNGVLDRNEFGALSHDRGSQPPASRSGASGGMDR